jgi:hypothetical protein
MKLRSSSHPKQTLSIVCILVFFLPLVLGGCGSPPNSFVLSTNKQIEYIF